MEKFFLSPIFSRDELDVVDHQDIVVAITLTETQLFIVADRVDHFVR